MNSLVTLEHSQEDGVPEYVIHAKLKNNLLLSRILRTHKSVSAFCEEHCLNESQVGSLLNLKERALLKNGLWSVLALRLAATFQVDPEDLFSEEQRLTALRSNEAFIELTRQQMLEMTDPFAVLEDKELVGKLLKKATLTEREREVLRLRFFEDETLDEIGKKVGVTRERIREIEMKAVRKLRGAARALENVEERSKHERMSGSELAEYEIRRVKTGVLHEIRVEEKS